ncbi:MAG: D-2-hydroxyacid dehydrogenase [Pseudomonadota bacterium]
MTDFPGVGDIKIHFAHSAYCLAERFAMQRPEIAHFQTWTPEETRERIGEGDVLVASGFWKNDLLPEATKLKFIQVCAVGHDQFDKSAIADLGVRLCNSAGVNANAVSDHAFALLLGLTRQVHVARSNQQKAFWRPMISDLSKREEELPGKTMLIYGVGQIGGRIAKLAKAFGMTVLGVRRDVSKAVEGIDELHSTDAFVSLLPRADVVVLACPLTDETRGLMNTPAFAAMKSSGYLINVARGGCVDQEALIATLDAGGIAGAGIDVTEPEPLPSESRLWSFENVILTPHTGGETRAYEDNVIDVLVDNLERLWRGEQNLRHGIV